MFFFNDVVSVLVTTSTPFIGNSSVCFPGRRLCFRSLVLSLCSFLVVCVFLQMKVQTDW